LVSFSFLTFLRCFDIIQHYSSHLVYVSSHSVSGGSLPLRAENPIFPILDGPRTTGLRAVCVCCSFFFAFRPNQFSLLEPLVLCFVIIPISEAV
jgi:hypothetical protein